MITTFSDLQAGWERTDPTIRRKTGESLHHALIEFLHSGEISPNFSEIHFPSNDFEFLLEALSPQERREIEDAGTIRGYVFFVDPDVSVLIAVPKKKNIRRHNGRIY